MVVDVLLLCVAARAPDDAGGVEAPVASRHRGGRRGIHARLLVWLVETKIRIMNALLQIFLQI